MDLGQLKQLVEKESKNVEFKLTTGQLERAAETLLTWEKLAAVDIGFDDLDHREIINTIDTGIKKGRISSVIATQDPWEALERLNLIVNNKITNAAVALYAKEPFPEYSQCLLKLALFRSTEKRNIIDSKQIYGHVFSLIEEAQHFFSRNISIASRFIPGKMQRIDEPDYPPLAIREAIINAVCHRDYTIVGSSISLMMYEDHLEVTSHGRLPNGIDIDSLKKRHTSQPRNPVIANVLYLSGMIEEMGIGIQEMISECKELNVPNPEFIENGNTFVVVFKKKPVISRDEVTTEVTEKEIELTERQKEILKILSKNDILKLKEILAQISDDPAERTLRDDLGVLKKCSLIDSQGSTKNTIWFLKK